MGKGLKKEDSAALKGLSVLIMVFIHCFRSAGRLERYQVVFRGITQEQILAFVPYGKICVSIFAFVSGFGLMYTYTKNHHAADRMETAQWVSARLLKLLSGFWVISLVSYTAYLFVLKGTLADWGNNTIEKAMAVLADMLGFSELFGTKYLNGAWWYMSAAAVYILLVPILAELIQRTGGGFSMALVIALPRVLGVKYQGGNAALTFLPVMLLGMICCRYDIFERFHELRITGNKRLDAMIKFIGLTAGVVFGRWSFDKVDAKIFAEYKFMVIPFFVILFCVEFLFHMKYLSLILGFFGKHSMNIWLVHTFVRDWIPQAAYGLKEFWTVPLVILGISLGISYVLMFVKRISGYDAFVEKLIHKIS